MANKENVITLVDEQGEEQDFELLFSIVYKKTNTRYIYLIDPNDKSEETVVVFSVDDDGNVSTVDDSEDDDLREFIQDTFSAYQNGDLVPVNEDGEVEEIEEEEHHCCCHEKEEDHECEHEHEKEEHHCCCHNK